jgi:hypothetical protein
MYSEFSLGSIRELFRGRGQGQNSYITSAGFYSDSMDVAFFDLMSFGRESIGLISSCMCASC